MIIGAMQALHGARACWVCVWVVCCLAFLFPSQAFSAQIEGLLAAFARALDHDAELARASSAVEEARAMYGQARAELFPQLSITANQKTNRGTFDFPSRAYALSFTQTLWDYGRFSSVREAQFRIAQAEIEKQEARSELMLRVTRGYLDLLAALSAWHLSKKRRWLARLHWDDARQRFRVGQMTKLDVLNARSAYVMAVSQEASAESSLEDAREALFEILGGYVKEDMPRIVEIPLRLPDPPAMEQWVRIAVENSQEILSSRKALQAATEAWQRANHARMPTLGLVAGHAFNDNSGIRYGLKTVSNYLGVELSMSVYAGGGISAGAKAAEERMRQAEIALEQAQRSIAAQCRAAYRAVFSAIASVKAQQLLLRLRRQTLALVEEEAKAGRRTSLDVSDAQVDVLDAEDALLHAQYVYLLSHLELKKIAGQLDEESVRAMVRYVP